MIGPMLWGSALDDFDAYRRAAGKADSSLRTQHHYLLHLAESHPSPWAVTEDDLVAYLDVPHWSPETRKSARGALVAFYSWAAKTRRIDVDPSIGLPTVRVPRSSPRPAPDPVVANAMTRCRSDRDRLMVLLAYLAGLRRAEIAAIHTDDIQGGDLYVRGKGGRGRRIPISPLLLDYLYYLPPGPFFPGKVAGHLSANRVGVILTDLLGRGWSGHCLRHSFASNVYAAERDMFALMEVLGHSKPETTLRYTVIPQDSARRAISTLTIPTGTAA